MKFTSTLLVKNLENVRSKLAGRKISARITVPPELDWWFYQEFGTASHFDEMTVEVPDSVTISDLPGTTAPQGYVIAARNGGEIRLPITVNFPAEWRGPSVHHMGVPPKAYIRRILPDIHKKTALALATALHDSDYDLGAVQEALMAEVMPSILSDIAKSMSEHLTATIDRDTPGKLGGLDPASEFESAATIVDSSG